MLPNPLKPAWQDFGDLSELDLERLLDELAPQLPTQPPQLTQATHTQPGIPDGQSNLTMYVREAAAAQTDPGLPLGFLISDDEYVPLPNFDFVYALDADECLKMLAVKHVRNQEQRTLPGSTHKLIAIDAHWKVIRLQTIKPNATAIGAQTLRGNSSNELPCATSQAIWH